MAVVIKRLIEGYDWCFRQLSDPRADEFPLMSSPFPGLAIVILYYIFVKDIGPKFMQDRQPFKLEKVMLFYNAFQIFINTYIVMRGTPLIPKYNILCEPVNYSRDPEPITIVRLVWLYFITKILDLIDTIFFVLRKKQSQVTFLHLYHHIGMVLLTWFGTKYFGGGSSVYIGYINACVHIIMYTYYLLSAWNSEYKKSIWWKKYITQIQMLQFLCFAIIYGQLLFRRECGYPKLPLYIVVPQNAFMFVLFADFYWKAYVRPKKSEDIQTSKATKVKDN